MTDNNERVITKLKQQRRQLKACVTNVESWLNTRAANATQSEVEVMLKRLHKYETRFEELQEQLEDLDPSEFERETIERVTFDERMSVLESSLLEMKTHDTTLNETHAGNISVDLVASELPKMELPKFSGDYLEFPLFLDTFKALVHNVNSRNMTDVRKFGLLKSCLVGQALDTISSLPLVANNYPVALQMLEERFLKKRLIFTSYIKKLWELTRATNTSSLRKLSDTYVAIVKGLELIATKEEISDGILVHLLTTKCDQKTIEEWEKSTAGKETLPTEAEFTKFLSNRCTQLEGVEYATKNTKSQVNAQPSSSKSHSRHSNVSSAHSHAHKAKSSCPQCRANHAFVKCPEFCQETPKGRYLMAKNLRLCIRCLEKKHDNCTVKCEVCNESHNSLLHFEKSSSNGSSPASSNVSNFKGGLKSSRENQHDTYTFLATALVNAQTIDGNFIPLRVMFDSGSQLNLISDRARQLLGLKSTDTPQQIQLSGINNSTVTLRKRVFVKLQSIWSSFNDSVMLTVHPKLRQVQPGQNVDISNWNIPNDIQLADPEFNRSQPVDIILNAHQVELHTLSKSLSLGNGLPRLRETTFGWIVVGDCAWSAMATSNVAKVSYEPNLNELLQKFWEVESIPHVKVLSKDDIDAETHFKQTTTRLPDGRFVVRLPFCRSPELLGESREIAERRLNNISRKINDDYVDFIEEYLALGHCSEITDPVKNEPHYYIPHFTVTNDHSTTTPTRVVFDASCPSDNGISINELLYVGPRLQDELAVLLLDFRASKYALNGDVSKMYRQILLHSDDQKYQYILWRKPGEKKIRVLQLHTVTYGFRPAPFQAVRCLKELAETDGDDLPLAKHALLHNFYVDDMLAGADTQEEVLEVYNQIKTLLSRAKMTIRKFQTNSPEVLTKIPEDERGIFLKIGGDDVIKTLGMNWYTDGDSFSYYYQPNTTEHITRRLVLSELSRLFDPLGLIQPVIIRAKLFMQHLFTITTDWDEPLPESDVILWKGFRDELKGVCAISIPRCVFDLSKYSKNELTFELHGFSDASEKAYAAAVYLRTIQPDGGCSCRLYTAKTKVAPLKKVSLPRLELLGAELLAELVAFVRPVIKVPLEKAVLWTDSTITLRWVTESPHKWTPYVATRSTKIQSQTGGCEWRHIPTHLNPADLATRGMTPKDIWMSNFWLEGPKFLRHEVVEVWPAMAELPEDVPEQAKTVTTLAATVEDDLFSRCKIMSFVPLITAAAWPKLRRIFGYVSRFITNTRKKSLVTRAKHATYDEVPPLTVPEIESGTQLIVKHVQKVSFPQQFTSVTKKNVLSSKSKMNKLSVILMDGILRVGGRLCNSPELTDDEKFPYLMPPDHVITKLIYVWYHFQNLHAGATTLLALVRQKFWPVKGKVLANRTVHGCVRCSKSQPVTYNQIMGDLPRDRVKLTWPFEVTAVDFAGPFMVHYRLRGSKLTKAYMAVFVCFSTKAVHLELVEDLTTEAFLNCLRRFTDRRNTPRTIWSDNATNFVGASRKLKELKDFYFNEETQRAIHDWCRDTKGLTWKFTPPRSPHFNGLVEAAVKSAKYHLVRVAQLESLTFSELNTVLIMVEGILNSRPLTPLSCDPNDGHPLTPAHFLLGSPLRSLPESDPEHVTRWDKAVIVKQHFWRRWSREYLQTLQEKHKWTKEQPGPKVNDLVLLVDTSIAPLKWKVAKVVKLYTGKDGKVRIIDVETESSKYSRAITEVCPIPREQSVLA